MLPIPASRPRSTACAAILPVAAAVSRDSTTTRNRLCQRRSPHRLRLPSAEEVTGTDGLAAVPIAGPPGTSPLPLSADRDRIHDWLVTELAATDIELGIVKTGKEADVFLLRRGVPGTSRSCLLAAKSYRSAEHRLFHRDSEYLEGRRVRNHATAGRWPTAPRSGRQMIALQWANAEFSALCQFYGAGVPGPLPGPGSGHRAAAGVHRRAGRDSRAPAGRDRSAGSSLTDLWSQLVHVDAGPGPTRPGPWRSVRL